MADAANMQTPVPQLVSYGWVDGAVNLGVASMALPVFGLSVQKSVSANLPVLQMQASGFSGVAGWVSEQPPTLRLLASGTTGVVGSVSLGLAVPHVTAAGPAAVGLAVPALRLSAQGRAGVLGTLAMSAPVPRLQVVGAAPYAGNSALALHVVLQSTGLTGTGGRVGTTLRALALAAQGYTGVVGQAGLVLPVVNVGARGAYDVLGTAKLVLPTLFMQATGRVPSVTANEAFVMHLEAQALSTYTNYPFNSMTQFNGVYLGASDAGIFALVGDTDAGTAIDAVVRLGMSDFGTSLIKRVAKAYVGYAAAGDLELRVITDGGVLRRYKLHTTRTGMHGWRVEVGKGILSRYWQFEVANVGGAGFTLNCVEITPTRMGRRVNETRA